MSAKYQRLKGRWQDVRDIISSTSGWNKYYSDIGNGLHGLIDFAQWFAAALINAIECLSRS